MKFKRFPNLVRCCWFGLNYLFREKISQLAITTVQYTVLRTLYDSQSKKLNQKDLAILIATNKNNLSSIVKRLEVLEYIVLLQNPCDKRENIIKITTRGQRVYLVSKEKADELQAEITQGMESTELTVLFGYLERINAKINNQQEDEKGC